MNQSLSGILLITAALSILMLWAFVRQPARAVNPPRIERPSDYNPVTTRPSDEGHPGEAAYRRYCSGCHGVNGDGQGPAASLLTPKPRDFTRGVYKFTTTPGGSLPLEEDLLRTITYGLKGTSMPSWRFLPFRERQSLIDYLKTFSWDTDFERPAVPFYENPYDLTDPDEVADAVAKGKDLYHKYQCWQCHPGYVSPEELREKYGHEPRANLTQPEAKPDLWGEEITPPDFPNATLKSVRNLRDLYRVITAGVGGTAMPTWSSLPGDDLWAIAIYVDSIRKNGSIHVAAQR